MSTSKEAANGPRGFRVKQLPIGASIMMTQSIMKVQSHSIIILKGVFFAFLSNFTIIRSDHKYISAVYSLTTIAMKRVFNPLCHSDFIFYLTSSGRKYKAACDYVHQYDEKVM